MHEPERTGMIEIGASVPDLQGTIQDASTLRLRDLRGRHVALYFYPKDNTAGCTRQAQDLRDLHAELTRAGSVVVGVSRDSVASHRRFAEKHALPFALVADTDETWCRAFDVIHEKTLYGRRYLGIVRSTFLIAPDGTLAAAWRNVKVPGHAAAVLDHLARA
jgi:peroxiredoxin Q/BCP